MSSFTRRAIIGAAAGAGLSVVGIGGLLALRGAGGTTLTATAVLSGGTGIAASSTSPPAIPTSTQVAAATAPPSVVPGTPPASAAPTIMATPPADTLGLPSGGKYTTLTPIGKRGGSIVEVTYADAATNNPMLSSDTSSAQRTQLQFEGLIDLNPDTALPFARLAAAVPTRQNGGISADDLSYTFKLRQGVRWSDGTPFTAKDVVYTFTTMQNPASGSPRAAELTERVASVSAVDDLTVVFKLKRPLAPFLVDNATYPIVPEHILGKVAPADLKTHPFSTGDTQAAVSLGPFKLSEWVNGDRAVFVKNPSYYGGEPALDRYVFRVVRDANAVFATLKANEADFGGVSLPQWEEAQKLPGFSGVKYDGFGFTYYAHQLDPAKTTLFQDKRVRRALALALDRDAIVQAIHNGLATVASGTMPPASWAAQPDKIATKYTYDVKKAEALLDEAGWVRGQDGIRARDGKKLQFTLWTNAGGTMREQYVTVMQRQWKAIGVDATPKTEEWAAFLARIAQTRDFEMFLVGFSWGTDPDQSMMWATDAYASGFNMGKYSNAHVDDLLKQGLAELDTDKRKALYLELQNILMDEVPSLILDFPQSTVLTSKRIRNLFPNAVNTRWNTHLWWTEDGR